MAGGAQRPGLTWRAAIEKAFERWGRFVVRHRWAALLATVAVTVAVLMTPEPPATVSEQSPVAPLAVVMGTFV